MNINGKCGLIVLAENFYYIIIFRIDIAVNQPFVVL